MKEKNLDVSLLLDFYSPILTDKQREVLEFYYNEDMSLAEIAEHELITRQGVRDNIKRGEKVLFDLENALGFAEKSLSVQSSAEKLKIVISELEEINQKRNFSEEIAKKLKELSGITEEILNI